MIKWVVKVTYKDFVNSEALFGPFIDNADAVKWADIKKKNPVVANAAVITIETEPWGTLP